MTRLDKPRTTLRSEHFVHAGVSGIAAYMRFRTDHIDIASLDSGQYPCDIEGVSPSEIASRIGCNRKLAPPFHTRILRVSESMQKIFTRETTKSRYSEHYSIIPRRRGGAC